MKLSTSILHSNQRHSVKCWLIVIILLKACLCASAQDTVDLPLYEEWDTYSATSSRNVNGWLFCKTGIDDESIVQRNNLHAFLTTGSTAGSGTVVATPYLSQVPDTFSFRLYGSSLNGHMALVEFGFIPDSPPIGTASDICGLFVPYDTVSIYTSNQWFRTTVDLHPYFAIHGFAHRFAIRLLNSYNQKLYLDEVGARKGNGACPTKTNAGHDFWMTFLPLVNNSELRLTFAADSATNITVEGPNGTIAFSLPANSSETRIVGNNNDIDTINTPFNSSYHITADHDIWVYANNDLYITYNKSGETATILPTTALDTVYIAQDYPPYTIDKAVSFVATQDNTVLSMVLPCPVRGTTLMPGDTLSVTLQRGQTYLLKSNSTDTDFSGMQVTSNGKPFAMYHGGVSTRVPVDASDGGDLTFEQAVSPKDWGREFIVPGFSYQGGNSYIRVTAAEHNTHLTIGGNPAATLNARQCHEHVIPTNGICRISSDKPVCVILYMTSYREGGNQGDPASITIPPLDRGVCKTMFRVDNFGGTNSHYLTVIYPTALGGSLQLDSAYLPTGATLLDEYTIHRFPISQGHHSLVSDEGPFVAFVYGLGDWKGYAYHLGYAFDTLHTEPPHILIHDTISFADSVCQGQDYTLPATLDIGGETYTLPFEGLIYVRTYETTTPGIQERWSNWVDGNIVHHIHLTLTVLPSHDTSISMYLTPGDTLLFMGDTLTEAGLRTYTLQAVNGCDSLVRLNLSYTDVTLSAGNPSGCPGDEVVITAEGSLIFNWSSTPYDAELDSQQGQNPITVHPVVTTTYQLIDASGQTISAITVSVGTPPALCVEINRDFIDFDYPVITLFNCSSNSSSSTWYFSDGYTLSGHRIRRQFRHPLPDSVSVTLHSCNSYNCCTDTTFVLKPRIRSVWFPNVFTPDAENNNRFGPLTSVQASLYQLTVFNRFGIIVFTTDDPDTHWDGTYNGLPLPQGTYVYHWTMQDAVDFRQSGTGTVTLLR